MPLNVTNTRNTLDSITATKTNNVSTRILGDRMDITELLNSAFRRQLSNGLYEVWWADGIFLASDGTSVLSFKLGGQELTPATYAEYGWEQIIVP